jgi:hypothetical protein
VVFAGGDGDFGAKTRVEAAPDMRKAVWNAIAVAQPFSRIAFSGHRRVEFYTAADAAKPAAVLFVNVTDASHLEGHDEDKFRCAGLTEWTEPLLRAEYERHHPPASQPAGGQATPEAALESVISLYRAGDFAGIRRMLSRPDAEVGWLAKGTDEHGVGRMRSFGEFLAKTEYRWSHPEPDVAVAAFGDEEYSPYYLRFVKRDGHWLLEGFRGGD